MYYLNKGGIATGVSVFLRIEFICIIWTDQELQLQYHRSWGLNLFVLFEHNSFITLCMIVLEDWIYLYYLNCVMCSACRTSFLRIEFICIIWTRSQVASHQGWFLRIEFICIIWTNDSSLWGLNRSWGLNLFVLFELSDGVHERNSVLEDWIYLYYLNG